MADPLDRLAVWLQPFSVTPNAETLTERRRLVAGLAADDALDPHTLVTAAHGVAADPEALVAAVRRIDGSVVLDGREDLAATLAAAALLVRLADAARRDVALLALLVQSARFLDLEPAVPDLPTAATDALAKSGKRERQRVEVADTTREIRGLLASAASSAEDLDGSAASLIKAVQNRDQALRAVAKRVESLVDWTEGRLKLVEEELDLLWWSRRGRRQTTDEPWDQLPPPQRAAFAALELEQMLAQVPAPTSARSILREVLGAEADAETPIAAVATAMEVPSGARRLLLTPLSTYVLILTELGDGETETAARLFSKTMPLASDACRPLIEIAEQVLRERQITALL